MDKSEGNVNANKLEWEDPARVWIDLVTAYKAGSIKQVKACLEIAKVSHWTHEEWDEATKDESENETESDGDDGFVEQPNAQDNGYWE